ncbi:MAG: small basic protein [Planctomycetota bacterium]
MTTTPLVPRWGAIHIHTDYSDGGVTLADTIAAAQRSGLDFIAVTDHNTLSARHAEGYHDKLLVQVDVEITPSSFGDHLLAFGLSEYPEDLQERPRSEFLREVTTAGGFAWVPHPGGFYYPWLGIWNSRWRDWNQHIGGLDLSTYLVEWVGRLRPWNLLRQLRGGPLPIFEPSAAVLRLWDHLNAQRPTAGFIGIDAHYRTRFGGRLHSPHYEQLFGTHNVLVWTPPPTGDAQRDLTELRNALRHGRFVNQFANVAGRGDVRYESRDSHLSVTAPDRDGTHISILRDGEVVASADAPTWGAQVDRPGVYRAEIRYRGQLWCLTNPIRIETTDPSPQDEASSSAPEAKSWGGGEDGSVGVAGAASDRSTRAAHGLWPWDANCNDSFDRPRARKHVMSVDKSLKLRDALSRHRNVLTRVERIRELERQGVFKDGESSPLGLPKVRVYKPKKGGKKKKKKDEEAEEKA